MKKSIILSIVSLFIFVTVNNAQVFYVDSENGNDINKGDINMPFKTIQKAVTQANNLTGKGSITIKILPGLYILDDKVVINPARVFDENSKFVIESTLLPGDSTWESSKMPVIMSCSENNSETQFPHSTGFLASSNQIEFRGIKFYGNANPNVSFYYPISRENANLKGLTVSQCIFVGSKNSANIQGGIWAHGNDIKINHCTFYQCRNAILLFMNINNTEIKNNIIYDAFESAFWMGDDENLVFENNIINNCRYFWVGNPESKIRYKLSNSIISENEHFTGAWGSKGITEIKANFEENNVNKSDKILLDEWNGFNMPQFHLQVKPESPGHELNAGISDISVL